MRTPLIATARNCGVMLAVLLLASCGGGDEATDVAPNTVRLSLAKTLSSFPPRTDVDWHDGLGDQCQLSASAPNT